jgi:hypothetical protein
MRIKCLVLFIITGILALVSWEHADGQFSQNTSAKSILERPVARVDEHTATITNATTAALSSAGVPGGIITVTGCGEDASYMLTSSGPTLGDALNSIMAAGPNYRLEVEKGVVNLVPTVGDPPLLGFRIGELKIKEAHSLFDALAQLLALPEVQKRIKELDLDQGYTRIGLMDLKRPGNDSIEKSPNYTISCKNVTVREALNAIARAHGRGVWAYRERHCNERVEFQLQFLVR